ncbi:MAG: class I SAM-dependent methyltransferase [Magnetococcales bacterium]|nr:class I SAM-dependent methyltransferase [Magnetococcales bacterium]
MNPLRGLLARWRPPARPAAAVQQSPTFDIEQDRDFMELHRRCDSYTATSIQKQYALYQAIRHVVGNAVPGDFVECGVFRGGSTMLAAWALRQFGDTSRTLYLYDTFSGMAEPTQVDRRLGGEAGGPIQNWQRQNRGAHNDWCYCSLEDVQANLALTGYPPERMIFVAGKVEDTLPVTRPAAVAILRLDTNFYESTRQEMRHLYPLLAVNGILLLDSYGNWVGTRQAVDEYLAGTGQPLFLSRIDKSGRIAVKT